MSWYPETEAALLAGNYKEVAQFYEQKEPESITHYWYLGLAYLLQGKEEEAQTTWLLAMSEGSEEEVEEWTAELVDILDIEAQTTWLLAMSEGSEEEVEEWTAELVNILDIEARRQGNEALSWLIREHIRDIEPNLLNNLLSLILLEIKLNYFQPAKLEELEIQNVLQTTPLEIIDQDLLLEVLKESLGFLSPEVVNLFKVALPYLEAEQEIINSAVSMASKTYLKEPFYQILEILELILEKYTNNLSLLNSLFWLYGRAGHNSKSLEKAESFYKCSSTSTLKLYGNYLLVEAKLRMANWLCLQQVLEEYQNSIQEMLENLPEFLEDLVADNLVFLTGCFFYLQDNPSETQPLRNAIADLFQKQYRSDKHLYLNSVNFSENKPLKIGYLSRSLRRHSVGWISRWLLHHHDPEKFEVILYLDNQPEDEITQNWFRKNAKMTYNFQSDSLAIAQQIQEDQINILVDMESSTYNKTCQILALKPAPIQVSWLGFDASGIPAIDYYIADPYVLPANAQEYYQEKIWRLPTTYLAVDGFEVGIVTLRREDLEIPDNAIIYLSSQSGLKRHPNTIRLQMKILKEVPKSYFLIQGLGDEVKIKQLFEKIAEEEGVSTDRLRFLGKDATEEIHRANLQIADIVLDTYPYNGATTTLEVLWMGIPIVTRVGEQFAARNSYTFIMNAGVSEGIAWNDEEYIDWGIRFGISQELRKEVTWKLREGQKTALLWNAKAFTQEMEKAYQQMWKIYCHSQKV